MNTKQLIDEAVSLPVDERALIVDSLLRSLNQPESEIDKKWAMVAKRRREELKSGVVEAIPGQNVFERIWNRLGLSFPRSAWECRQRRSSVAG